MADSHCTYLEGSSMAVVFWTLSTPEPVVSMSNSFAAL